MLELRLFTAGDLCQSAIFPNDCLANDCSGYRHCRNRDSEGRRCRRGRSRGGVAIVEGCRDRYRRCRDPARRRFDDRESCLGKGDPQYEAEGILGMAMPSVFALATRRLMETQGATIQDFAQVAVKAHNAVAVNPASQSCQRTTLQVLNSRMIADPITVLQCCPGTEAAAAIILCSGSFARRYTTRLIHIVASVALAGDGLVEGKNLTSISFGYQAARQAYELAGVGPYDLVVVEVHDGFAGEEILHYEDLELCPRGQGIALLSLRGRVARRPNPGESERRASCVGPFAERLRRPQYLRGCSAFERRRGGTSNAKCNAGADARRFRCRIESGDGGNSHPYCVNKNSILVQFWHKHRSHRIDRAAETITTSSDV